MNPFLTDWTTPFGIPPFADISVAAIEEAYVEAFAQLRHEVEQIASNPAPADFTNTVEAFERAGALMNKVNGVFGNLCSSDNNEALQELQGKIAPQQAAINSEIYANQALYGRIKAVAAATPQLADDQQQLLQDLLTTFERAGAALDETARAEIATIDQQLATLKTDFGNNILQDSKDFELVIDDPADLAGLPDYVVGAALAEGEERGRPGQHVFTISRSSITPFLQFADNRELREKIYRAYTECGNNDNDANNLEKVRKIAALRARRANLLGFPSHASYMLDDRMARTPEGVNRLLDQIWEPAKARVREEAAELQELIQESGDNFALQAWDWFYFTEKLRKRKFNLRDEEVKPYFELNRVREGVFGVVNKLYGLSFRELDDAPKYHPDVRIFEVTEGERHIGTFIADYFMRPSKRAGAWMSNFRSQSSLDGEVRPIVVNCCNFPKGNPSLLGMDEVRTLFHEFGHALHSLLSQCRYESQSGTSVKQDFVELPSQIMEHWAVQREVLKEYACHYETGEPIPDALIDKLLQAGTFNQGFATTEYLAASYLDMAWHTLTTTEEQDVAALEASAMQDIDMIEMLDPRYRSTYFQHIFSGDSYSAGYYSYIWAEVLDADGFEAFKENGIFDQDTARAFRENVLEKGGTEDPMTLYQRFRGREPDVAPLLTNRGLA